MSGKFENTVPKLQPVRPRDVCPWGFFARDRARSVDEGVSEDDGRQIYVATGTARRSASEAETPENYAAKLDPHPQVAVAFGFSNVKPRASSPSL